MCPRYERRFGLSPEGVKIAFPGPRAETGSVRGVILARSETRR